MRRMLWAGVGVLVLAAVPAGHAARPPADPVARLVAHDFSFGMPDRLPAGRTRLRFVNRGSEPHYARLLRIPADRTLSDYMAARARDRRQPDWVVPAGGIAPISPGDSTDATLRLEPGRYLVLCGYPGRNGRQHLDHGMIRQVEVSGPAAPAAAPPPAPVRLRLGDSAVAFSSTPRRGRRAITVQNTGNQFHQALIIQLAPGTTLNAERAWFEGGFRTARPGRPHGGVIELRPGERVDVVIDFPPGRYAVLCHVVERGGRSHFEQRELLEFTVR